jgi:hypothetical protein
MHACMHKISSLFLTRAPSRPRRMHALTHTHTDSTAHLQNIQYSWNPTILYHIQNIWFLNLILSRIHTHTIHYFIIHFTAILTSYPTNDLYGERKNLLHVKLVKIPLPPSMKFEMLHFVTFATSNQWTISKDSWILSTSYNLCNT